MDAPLLRYNGHACWKQRHRILEQEKSTSTVSLHSFCRLCNCYIRVNCDVSCFPLKSDASHSQCRQFITLERHLLLKALISCFSAEFDILNICGTADIITLIKTHFSLYSGCTFCQCLRTKKNLPMTMKGVTPQMSTKGTPMRARTPKAANIPRVVQTTPI